ncbi:TetR family transcriptional regulator [Haloactinospora alba]|uniref:TetR family transcriptional regulator n=1 Tax=Haloactinospora alba TaxID=405555 RepID=A0A543NLP0_9ACTN|nr:TetR/AcrR family transcriptional regulator [Haloactinospora alba]TQN32729.1 TetR family transcriptional regulator [Haloactinospora alba]
MFPSPPEDTGCASRKPVTARRQGTRQRLFEAAVALISEQGVESTSVDRIAERAGVAKGTVYYNFSGKEELYATLIEWGVDRLAGDLRAASAGPPREALFSVLRAELEFIGTHEALARLLMAEAWRTGQAWYTTARHIRDDAIGAIAELLDSMAAEGQIPSDLDTGVASSALFGMTVTVALDWRALQPERPIEEIHATLVRMAEGFLTAP